MDFPSPLIITAEQIQTHVACLFSDFITFQRFNYVLVYLSKAHSLLPVCGTHTLTIIANTT